MQRAIGFCQLGALALLCFPASADPLVVNRTAILAAHNNLRAELGVPPLRWSDRLANGAAQWARTVATRNQLQHSGQPGVGENIAVGWGTQASLAQMLSIWAKEKLQFRRGLFPQVSSDGGELSVLHYTQMIWRNTTEIGCGAADKGKTNFLVCWYAPEGNYIGQSPY